MSESRERALARNLYRNLRILALLTVIFVITLALAPFKWHNSEWRNIQKEYNRRARAQGEAPVEISLKQIWRPEANLTDRCTSCHLGMGAATPLKDGGLLFGPHPDVSHEVGEMGCTICHRGQGRATRAQAAHGNVEHWEDPMLPRSLLESSCGTCHGAATATPDLKTAERGHYLFQLNGCPACHRVDGVGGTVGPDLSGVALKGYDREWQISHLRSPSDVVEGSQMMSFGHLTSGEIDQLLGYMDTLIGAPALIRGKALVSQEGCRGCHRISGPGGDFGGSLSEAAHKKASEYDFSHVEGPETLENWERSHLRNPSRVAPGTTMPAYRLDPEDEDALITYIFSLREPDIPMEQLPRETILNRLEERRDFASDGETLFRTFCSACHGPEGRGQAMATLGTTVPDLRNRQTRALLSADSTKQIIQEGRPERFMPAWGSSGAGLRDEEIESIVSFLRSDLPDPPPFSRVESARADLGLGRVLFRDNCSFCHGKSGEGTIIAPNLTNPEFLFVADDSYLYRTITQGRPGTAMPAHRDYGPEMLASLIGWIRETGRRDPSATSQQARAFREKIQDTLFVERVSDYRASGSPAYGKTLFDSMCVSCHGELGQGGVGPALGNPVFLKSAPDGLLAGTILLGRSKRAMRSFGSDGIANLKGREVGDLISYIRRLPLQPERSVGVPTVQGNGSRGKELFESLCAGCHGVDGRGRIAPSLRSPNFLSHVSDGFLQATLVRGRPGTPMRSWARGGQGFAELEPADINDIVHYIRGWQDSH